jgi:glucose-6-phosphate 1-epimerase
MNNLLRGAAFCNLKEVDELTCLHINHPKFFAEVCLQGAQLTQFRHRSKGDLIWLSPDAFYKKGRSIRGGIPVCWPWFGALDFNPDAIKQAMHSELAHGFARQLNWSLQNIHESAQGVRLTLTLSHTTDTLKIWPHEFCLSCHIDLGDDIKIKLTTQNLSNTPMVLSQALHTYLPTHDIHQTRILGAKNGQYIDALDNWQLKQQQGSIGFTEEVDRIYLGHNQYQILAHNKQFTLNSNSQSSIIWNPWINKSKRLAGFPHNGYEKMFCIESANVLSDSIALTPGESHTLEMSLDCIDPGDETHD